MTATRFRPWMCLQCGYVTDAVSPADDGADAPVQGDISMCLNCGGLYELKGETWQPLSELVYAGLPAELRELLVRQRRARAAVIRTDLAKGRGGRA